MIVMFIVAAVEYTVFSIVENNGPLHQLCDASESFLNWKLTASANSTVQGVRSRIGSAILLKTDAS